MFVDALVRGGALPGTVLSTASNAAEHRTLVLARTAHGEAASLAPALSYLQSVRRAKEGSMRTRGR